VAKAGSLERGHVKVELIRLLAAGEDTYTSLAARFGVAQPSISAFAKRHAERIADVSAKLDEEFAGLWVAEKRNRIAELQEQVDRVTELITDPEKAAKAGVGAAEMERVIQTALRAVSEELGQLPARVQVQHSGQMEIVVSGVDTAALR
jgi:hypothetical protein